ncbi:MAG: oxygenase MpaB family protein [Bacteroidota bacterium]
MPFELEKIDADVLNKKRTIADPEMDQLLGALIAREGGKVIGRLFKSMEKGVDFEQAMEGVGGSEQLLECYWSRKTHFPAWLDIERMKNGQKFFEKHLVLILVVLQYKSLPLCYSCRNGAKILYMTGKMSGGDGSAKLYNRLNNTARMVVDTMSPGAFISNENTVSTLFKVRLIHALVRASVKNERYNPKGWDVEELGEPINQEDLAGTLLAFGPSIISGLEKLGVKMSQKDRDDYVHCWKMAGYLLGIDEDLLTDSFDDGWRLALKILSHQVAPSAEGEELTKTCIEIPKKVTAGIAFKEMPEYLIRLLLSDESIALGVDIGAVIGAKKVETDYKKVIGTVSKIGSLRLLNYVLLTSYRLFNQAVAQVATIR